MLFQFYLALRPRNGVASPVPKKCAGWSLEFQTFREWQRLYLHFLHELIIHFCYLIKSKPPLLASPNSSNNSLFFYPRKEETWRKQTFMYIQISLVSWHLKSVSHKPVNPKGNQPWIFIKGLMLKTKLQYFGHLIWRADSMEKILMLGKTEGKRRSGQQRMRWLDSTTDSMDMNLSKLRKIMKDREAWSATVHCL